MNTTKIIVLALVVAIVLFAVLAEQSPTGNKTKLFTYNYSF